MLRTVQKSRWMPGQVVGRRAWSCSPPPTTMQGTQPRAAGEKGKPADGQARQAACRAQCCLIAEGIQSTAWGLPFPSPPLPPLQLGLGSFPYSPVPQAGLSPWDVLLWADHSLGGNVQAMKHIICHVCSWHFTISAQGQVLNCAEFPKVLQDGAEIINSILQVVKGLDKGGQEKEEGT